MEVGRICFNPRIESALAAIKDEAINSKMWEEEFHKKDYECEELKARLANCKCGCKVKGKRVVR